MDNITNEPTFTLLIFFLLLITVLFVLAFKPEFDAWRAARMERAKQRRNRRGDA